MMTDYYQAITAYFSAVSDALGFGCVVVVDVVVVVSLSFSDSLEPDAPSAAV